MKAAAAAAAVATLISAHAGTAGGAAPPAVAFREAAAATGLAFVHDAGADGQFRLPEIMGSGVALLDYDGDGDLDVFVLQASPQAAMRSRFFQNRLVEEGRLRFVDVTASTGVSGVPWAMGVAVGDYDNDGDPDMYVTASGSNALFRNEGNGRFVDVTAHAGVDDPRWNAGAAFVDYDADGDLDLFVTAYVDFTEAGNKPCFEPGGQRDYCLPAEFRPLPARLFRNDGDGRFSDVTAASGIGSAAGAGLGVVAFDANADGRLDLYVANDGTPNHLWLNNGDGTFRETGLLSGTAFDVEGRAQAGMGVSAADFDADGDEDLFVTNLIGETNTVYESVGGGRFEDVTARLRLAAGSRRHTGFGTEWFDADNDGLLDLFVTNGGVAIVNALRGRPHPYGQPDQLMTLLRDGTYRELAGQPMPGDVPEVGRGAAFGDLDNDGDVDIVVSNNNGPLRLLLNESARAGRWLSIRLEGTRAARDGQGALVRFLRRGTTPLIRRARTHGSYLSAHDPRVHVGLGDAALEGIVVEWRPRERERFPAPGLDRTIVLHQGTGTPVAAGMWSGTPDVGSSRTHRDREIR
ncbi:MAG TPA: CRTAC1 family protein [Vicinamibacterales bacterium]